MPVTLHAYPNEKVYAYLEVQEQAPNSKGFHRYRLIYVNRDGNMSEYREDMGKASKFKGAKTAIHIPSVWEHTVMELISLADELRYDTAIDVADWLELDKMKLA